MIDEDEGEQHAAAGEVRPMLSIKQVLALIPFSRATLYRKMEAGRFPAAHEIAPRRIAWFKDEVASWQLATAAGRSDGIKNVSVAHAREASACGLPDRSDLL
jgi:prophage regulatory protein